MHTVTINKKSSLPLGCHFLVHSRQIFVNQGRDKSEVLLKKIVGDTALKTHSIINFCCILSQHSVFSDKEGRVSDNGSVIAIYHSFCQVCPWVMEKHPPWLSNQRYSAAIEICHHKIHLTCFMCVFVQVLWIMREIYPGINSTFLWILGVEGSYNIIGMDDV